MSEHSNTESGGSNRRDASVWRQSPNKDKASIPGRPPRPSSGEMRSSMPRQNSRGKSLSGKDWPGIMKSSGEIQHHKDAEHDLSFGNNLKPVSSEQSHRRIEIPPLSFRSSSQDDQRQYLESPFQKQAHIQRRSGDDIPIAGLRGSQLDIFANAAKMSKSANMDSDISPEKMMRQTWDWLSDQPEDAAELAQLLFEATPRLGVTASTGSPKKSITQKNSKRSVPGASLSLLDRLKAAQPMATGSDAFKWEDLTSVCPTELLQYEEMTVEVFADLQVCSPPDRRSSFSGDRLPSPRGDIIEVNSGGQVFFCFFTPNGRSRFAPERILVLKFHPSRLTTQSEQFANELTRYVGICSPCCRILRQQGPSSAEWIKLKVAAASLGKSGADLQDQLSKCSSCLVMEFIPGLPLFEASEPFQTDRINQTASDLGRLFILDMLLGNPDRLSCQALNWRGNRENLRYCNNGNNYKGRMVAIDAVVQRRPPGGLVTKEDAACNELTELALNDLTYSTKILNEAISPSNHIYSVSNEQEACAAFQASLKQGLQAMMRVKGLLEMMFEVLSDWIGAFIEDIEGVEAAEGVNSSVGSSNNQVPSQNGNTQSSPSSNHTSPRQSVSGNRWGAMSPTLEAISTTQKIRSIGREARQNQLISHRLEVWKARMRERGEELRTAVEEWQIKHSQPNPSAKLTTGFLDGTHPVVDAYELKVRLEHMLQRLRALQDASATARPTQLLPYLYVSGAVEASSLHVLRHLGITHILNATEDLLLPEESAGFRTLRCPIRDEEEVNIAVHFMKATEFIEQAKSRNEAVLVHCHEGKSRSVSLILAYLMRSQKWTLKEALEYVRVVRPEASPNAGFLAHLLKLDQALHGKRTVNVSMKRTKPELRSCPVCSERVGLSSESLALHVRKCHPEHAHRKSLTGSDFGDF